MTTEVPTQIAYDVLCDVLAGEPCRVETLTTRSWAPGPLTGPPAYTVLVTPNDFHIGVSWLGRFGEPGAVQQVPYPVPADDPDFRDALAGAVLPLVRDYQRAMQAAKLADYATDAPGDVYTVEDAVQPIW